MGRRKIQDKKEVLSFSCSALTKRFIEERYKFLQMNHIDLTKSDMIERMIVDKLKSDRLFTEAMMRITMREHKIWQAMNDRAILEEEQRKEIRKELEGNQRELDI